MNEREEKKRDKLIKGHVKKNKDKQLSDVRETANRWQKRWSDVYKTPFVVKTFRLDNWPFGIDVRVSYGTAIGQRNQAVIISEEELGWNILNQAMEVAVYIFEELDNEIKNDIMEIGLGRTTYLDSNHSR